MSRIVWTNHALKRNKERKISTSWVEQTINNPDNFSTIEEGRTKSWKKFNKHTVSVIYTKTKEGQYLVLSSWINFPNYGTADYKNKSYNKQMKKAGAIKKFWLTFLKQLGI